MATMELLEIVVPVEPNDPGRARQCHKACNLKRVTRLANPDYCEIKGKRLVSH